MKYILAIFLAVTLMIPTTTSEIPGVTVKQVSAEAGRESGERVYRFLLGNDTADTIRVVEMRVCWAREDCETRYLTGRFPAHQAAWSHEYRETGNQAITAIILTRVQTVEDK